MPYVQLSTHRLYYELHGNKDANETVAFFNGVMTSTASWATYSPLFEKLDFQVLLHDFKGQVQSDKPDGPYTFMEHAEEAKQLIDYLSIEKIHIVSTSYGSQAALRMAIAYPERIESLTIIDGTSEIDETSKLIVEGWKRLAKEENGEAFFWGVVPSLYYNEFVEKNLPFLEERAKMLSEIDSDFFKGQIRLYETFITDTQLDSGMDLITCPVLVVYGEEDVLTPRKFSETIVRNISNVEFAIIPKSGHVTIFEKSDVVKSLALGFIIKHSMKLSP